MEAIKKVGRKQGALFQLAGGARRRQRSQRDVRAYRRRRANRVNEVARGRSCIRKILLILDRNRSPTIVEGAGAGKWVPALPQQLGVTLLWKGS